MMLSENLADGLRKVGDQIRAKRPEDRTVQESFLISDTPAIPIWIGGIAFRGASPQPE